MAWIKVESSVARNRKFVKAGPAPSWLWLCGLAYCQEGLTDGFIPIESIDFLGVKNASRLAVHLVEARLWEPVDGGWQVHDYLDHNKSATAVNDIRQTRREVGANGGLASGEARRTKQTAKQIEEAVEASHETTSKQPSNPSTALLGSATETATATALNAHARTRQASIQQPRRKDAAWEGARVYVPQRVHTDFLSWRGDGSEPELWDFYAVTDYAWKHGRHAKDETGSDMILFWKARYDEKWPATKLATPSQSGARPAYSGWSCDHMERCDHRSMCESKHLLGPQRHPVKSAAVSA